MVGPIRTPLLVSLTAMLAAGLPVRGALLAQRADASGARRAAQAESSAAIVRRLRQRADSLAQLYNDNDDLSAAQRRAIGEALDRTVLQIEELTDRAADADSRMVRVQVQSMMNERDAAAMSNALRRGEATRLVMPRGWLGIVVSGTGLEPRVDNGEIIVRYLTHPEIVSVEPRSPAERAGLVPSDTLVAYDGRDVRDRDISLTKLLQPNARVLVRIRRDGRTKDIPVTIADVPSRIRLRTETTYEPSAPVFPRVPLPSVELAPRAIPATPVRAPMPPMPALPPTPMMITVVGFNSVAGAQLAALTEGLARSVGVPRGVLVTYAAVGSPAYESGLRDGDVIVRVAGVPVRTIAELREQVQLAVNNGENRAELAIVREKRERVVVLRWNGAR